MDYKLNSSPHLSMDEITKQLFNRNLHSDIRFVVNGKIIYAHSLVLILRSAVFERELKTVDKTKVIQITNYKYENFAEFIRYLYTNDWEYNFDNGIELLSLAIRYQVLSVENRLINEFSDIKFSLKLFEYCVLEKYEFLRNRIFECVAFDFLRNINTTTFLELHPDAAKKILQFDRIGEDVTEIEIFNILAKVIKNYCTLNHKSLTQGRQQFDGLIREIRFGTMSIDEVEDCFTKYPELVTKCDYESIKRQLNEKDRNKANELWNSKRRIWFENIFQVLNYNHGSSFETIFTVSKEVILRGFWIGVVKQSKETEIKITATDINTTKSHKNVFTQSTSSQFYTMGISLGTSIRLKPAVEYSIVNTYLQVPDGDLMVNCRQSNEVVKYTGPEDCIQITKAGPNMFEIIFKSVPN